jgi:membrane protease YdiL (CAAX protease family)
MPHQSAAIDGEPGWGDVAALLGLGIYALLPMRPGPVLAAVGIALLLASFKALPGDRAFSRAARAVVGTLSLYAALAGAWYIWPAYLLAPLLLAGLFGYFAGFGRSFLAAMRRGRLGRAEWAAIGLVALIAAAALVGWVALLQPDLSRQRAMLPEWPLIGLVAAGMTFSIVNAILEEFIWRGVLLDWLRTFMPGAAAVLVQAASFGAAHFMGFPSGFAGAALAAVYGVMLGALALRAGGLLAAIIAHIAADAVIFTLLATQS